MKIYTIGGLKGGGGKTSLNRLLCEDLGGAILNFDPHRNAELYNSIPTLNILENQKIKREKDFLMIDGKKVSSKSGIFTADFGGRFDERLTELQSDCFIFPSADDYESISETIRTALFVLNKDPQAKIIFILNKYLIRNKKDEETALNDFIQLLKENGLTKYKVLEMPYSKIFKNMVNEGKKAKSFLNSTFAQFQYRNITKFLNELKKEISK